MRNPHLKAEIFGQKIPCTTCPFSKANETRHSREQLASYMSYFVVQPGATFPCHKSVPKDDPRTQWSAWRDGQVLCAGGLIFAAKLGAKTQLVQLGEAMGWYQQDDHTREAKALVFDSVGEMLAAASDANG